MDSRAAGKKMTLTLLLALIISWIEEPLFRGILLTGLQRKLSVAAAIIVSATYYAVLHFLDASTNIPYQELTILSGFELLGEAFANLLNPEILPAFWALIMVGIFLGILRTRIKASLGLCIGCHTCWVWQIKMSKSVFNTNFSSDYLYLVSSYDGVIGPLVTGWLSLAIIGFILYRRINKPVFIKEREL
jgi:CAAX protease family protein